MLAVLEKFGGPFESKKRFAEQAAQLETRINDMLGECRFWVDDGHPAYFWFFLYLNHMFFSSLHLLSDFINCFKSSFRF